MNKKGITVINIKDILYCALCGMLIVNEEEWKELHLAFHERR